MCNLNEFRSALHIYYDYNASTYWVAQSRNFRTSARLHLQHLLFQNTLGYLVDSRVQSSIDSAPPKPLAVADLGCGNGIWLIDLERELSKKGVSAQLDGFDVNPVLFPAAEFLPQSVTLKKLDILSRPLPQEMIGAYDIVHVRAFASIVASSNATPLLTTVTALLKPGGWLQWEESWADGFLIDSPSPDISKSTCDTIAQMLKAAAEARGLKFDFTSGMDRILTEHGFDNVYKAETDVLKQDLKGWTDDNLMVWEELYALFPPKAVAPEAPMTRELWVELFAKAVEETENGVVIHHGKIVAAVGRKPAS
ncbi:hypothetical protein GGR54DRAFT_647264 [Hypoxylon sp. NC1633]|nr:hypothetical protein GGR54DRAFT_647264 [Hypoxylon sp. NC1633]